MANAVVAVFDEYNEAQSTVNELLVAGFNKNEVRLTAEEESSAAPIKQDREPEGGLKGFFNRLFGSDDQRDDIRLYDEAVRHGNYVVTAIATTDEKSELASEVMSHHHPVDLDERSSEWLGSEAQESGGISAGQQDQNQSYTEESRSIPVIEEEVKVGKREVQRGGVRIFQRVSEVPIEEDITLRQEQIVVERIPVNKPATDADLGAFQEGSAELRERSEEAVVSKQARVVEEVRVGKQVTQRKEKVRETARRTDVDVERTGSGSDQYSTNQSSNDLYRQHWQQNYSNLGGRYEDYSPAYEYGSTAGSSTLYQGRQWDAVEPELRSDWESRYPGSAWERFKDSIRHAFSGGRKS